MSNVKKSFSLLREDTSGGYYIVDGKLTDGDENERLLRQKLAADGLKARNAVADAEDVLRESIVKGRSIIERAKAEAEEMLECAQKKGFTNGYEDGYREGLGEGRKAAMEAARPAKEAIGELAERLEEQYSKPEEADDHLEEAFALAEKLIELKLRQNDEAFFGLYRKAALHFGNVETATLRAGPRGIGAVERDRRRFEDMIEGLEELKTVVSGEEGTCVLETPLGNIDSSVGAQLSRAKRIVLPEG